MIPIVKFLIFLSRADCVLARMCLANDS